MFTLLLTYIYLKSSSNCTRSTYAYRMPIAGASKAHAETPCFLRLCCHLHVTPIMLSQMFDFEVTKQCESQINFFYSKAFEIDKLNIDVWTHCGEHNHAII